MNCIGRFFMQIVLTLLASTISLGEPATAKQFLWQTNSEGNDVHIIDVAMHKVVKHLVVGPQPHGIAAPDDGHIIYVSIENNSGSYGELIWINPRTYEITYRMKVGPEPHAIATTPDGRWVYVPCRDGHYWIIDAKHRQVVKKIKTGGRPHNTQASRDGKYMYLSPMGDPQRVTIVDVEAGHQVIGEIPFSASVRPPALSADNKRFYQHIDGLNGFQVADIPTRKVIATVKHKHSLGWFRFAKKLGWFSFGNGFNRCHGLAIRPDQEEIWSCCGERVNVHSLKQTDYPETHSVPITDDVYWITFSPDSRYSFAAVSSKNEVVMIDAQTKQVITYIKVGDKPKRNLVITGHESSTANIDENTDTGLIGMRTAIVLICVAVLFAVIGWFVVKRNRRITNHLTDRFTPV